MNGFKIFGALVAGLMVFGCSTGSHGETIIAGYNEDGDYLSLGAAKASEMCSSVNSYYAARCEDSGFEILVADQCEILCSGPAEL